MPTLSAVIITFNEEKNIERCLQSVASLADEIIVVDSFSTDMTEEICKKYGVKFFKHAFGGYIEQKNYALTLAACDYVLSLDADEALDEKLKESIQKEKNNFSAMAYSMNRLTNYCGKWIKHGGWYPDKKIRLFKKNSGKWTGDNPHDSYTLNNDSKISHLKGNILHYSYYSVEQHIKQAENFSMLSAKSFFKRGKKPNLIKLFFSPAFRFIKGYFIDLGFLDGKEGFLIAKISARATYLKYKKLQQLYLEKIERN